MIPIVHFIVGQITVTLDLRDFPREIRVTSRGPAGKLTGTVTGRVPPEAFPDIIEEAIGAYEAAAALSGGSLTDAEIADTLNGTPKAQA